MFGADAVRCMRRSNGSGGLEPGMIAKYTMDNISGSTLHDEGGVYDGNIDGATQDPSGVVGSSLYFNTAARVNIPSLTGFWQSAFSVTGYAKVLSTSGSRIIMIAGTDERYATTCDLVIYQSSGNHFIRLSDGSSFIGLLSIFSPKITVDSWYEFALTWDGSTGAGGLKFYINKTLVGSAAVSNTNVTSRYGITLGARPNTFLSTWPGNQDELVFWGHELTQEEINEL